MKTYVYKNVHFQKYKKETFTNHGSAANSVSTFLQNTGAKNIILWKNWQCFHHKCKNKNKCFQNIKKVWPVKDCRFSIRTRKTSNHVKKMASLSAGLPAPPFVIHLRMIQDLGKVFFGERNVLFLYNDNSVYRIHLDHLMRKCKKNMFFSSSMVWKLNWLS